MKTYICKGENCKLHSQCEAKSYNDWLGSKGLADWAKSEEGNEMQSVISLNCIKHNFLYYSKIRK